MVEFRAHQEKELDRLAVEDSAALLWDMRTGKTLPVLMDISDKIMAGEVNKWLWIAPLSALGAVTRNTNLLTRERQEGLRRCLTCINYDKLSRKGSKYQTEIASHDWDGITLDEGHKIKNPQSNITKYILGTSRKKYKDGLCRGVRFRRFLTGTPVANSKYEDFWCMFSFLDDDYKVSYKDFMYWYCVTRQLPGTYVKIVVGYRYTDEILERVKACSSVVRLEDVTNAPDDNADHVITVPFSKVKNKEPFTCDTKTIYDEALASYVDDINMVMDNPMARLARLRMICAGSINNDEGKHFSLACEKTKYTLDVIQNFEGKVVVFHFFSESGDRLCEALSKHKIKYKQLNGKTPSKQKQVIWQQFQEDKDCKVFVSQINSGGTGIDLYTADMIIFSEPCLSSVDLEQARKRIADVNATVAKSFVFLLTEGSIEEDIYDKLKKHEGFTDKVFQNLIVDKAVNCGSIDTSEARKLKAKLKL